MQRYGLKAQLAAAGAVALLAAACDDRSRPVDAPQPAPLAALEAAGDLPYAEPSQVDYAPAERGYQWAERAYGLQRTFHDAPPDYGFYYDDAEPYVWETADDWTLYAEPADGAYRYYYYEPGADFPYFVRDDTYGYAYGPTGILVAVFDTGGRYLSRDVAYRVAPGAGRYYARGHDLRRAAREARRVQVDDRVWVTEGPRVSRSAGPWLRAARDQGEWRKWRERDGDRELKRFQAETRRREDAAAAWRKRIEKQQVATFERPEPQARKAAAKDRAEADKRQAQIARAQAEADRRQVQMAREQARFEQRTRDQQQRQAQAEQRASRDSERRQQQMAQQQRRQQAQSERREARAPSASDSGQPAAARERAAKPDKDHGPKAGGPPGKDGSREHGKKD